MIATFKKSGVKIISSKNKFQLKYLLLPFFDATFFTCFDATFFTCFDATFFTCFDATFFKSG